MAGLVLAVAVAAFAQGGAGPRSAQPAGRTQNKSIHFGDIVLSDYDTAELVLGKSARAEGRGTTVDFADPNAGRKGRLQASQITARMVAKSNNAVERIDAVGNVRFEGSAPASPSGTQTVRASGSKGSYQKQKLLLDLDGPVRFFSEQPTPDGKGRQSVAGRSDAAAYDEGRSVLTLSGNVEATVHTPETPQEGSTFTGDRVTVDMSERPYKVKITGGRVDIRLKDREPQSR